MNMERDDERDDSFESLASGGGMRGEIRKEARERQLTDKRSKRKKLEEDPYASTALGRRRRGRDDDENLL